MLYKFLFLFLYLYICCIIGCTSENSRGNTIFPTPPAISEDKKEITLPENQRQVWTPPVILEPHVINQAAEIIPKDDVPPHLIISSVFHGDRGVALKTDRFTFIFNEMIHATNFVKLIDNTTGLNMGWLPFVENKKIEVRRTFGNFGEGSELLAGHIYTIEMRVADESLNWTEQGNISFLTEIPVIKVSFKDDIQPILAERCTIPGCHAAPGVAGLDLSKYDTVKKGGANGPAFVAGDGKGSLVVERIDGGGMPPIPPPLNANQVQLFIDWIDEGAKNN